MVTGTKRLCAGGDHKVELYDGKWYHLEKSHWIDKPHKASPRKYKRKDADKLEERET